MDRRRKLLSWSMVGIKGINGEAMKCIEIGKNTNNEKQCIGLTLTLRVKS